MNLFRNVVKSFYTASLLYEAQTQFGELSEEVSDVLQIINNRFLVKVETVY